MARRRPPTDAVAAGPGGTRLATVDGPNEDLVEVAVLGRPWGVHGDLNVRLSNDNSECLWAGPMIWLALGSAAPVPVRVDAWQEKGARVLVRFEGVTSPEAAAALVHGRLLAPRASFEPEDVGEYYVHDLVGSQVIDQHGHELGHIEGVFGTGANDVWVVRGPQGERLIPAVAGFVVDVDRQARVVRVSYDEI